MRWLLQDVGSHFQTALHCRHCIALSAFRQIRRISHGSRTPFRIPRPGGVELAARLEPTDGPLAYALFAHCFTCHKDVIAASRISRALARHGIATLRFDFTGLGGSDGDFANTNFSSNTEDLLAVADHMRRDLAAPAILIGHSLGGAAALAVAGSIKECRAVVTIGAPALPGHVAHLLDPAREEIESTGEANVKIGGRAFRVRKQFLDDLDQPEHLERIRSLDRALLLMHSPSDEVVGIDNAAAIYAAAKHPKSFIALDGADHMLRQRQDAEFVANLIGSWAQRYILAPAAPPPNPSALELSCAV